jgi:hypothetical protein
MRRQVSVQLTTLFRSIIVMLLHEDRRTDRLTDMTKLIGEILLLLTTNVLKFYECTNVIINCAHFILRFSFTETRVWNFHNCYEQHRKRAGYLGVYTGGEKSNKSRKT